VERNLFGALAGVAQAVEGGRLAVGGGVEGHVPLLEHRQELRGPLGGHTRQGGELVGVVLAGAAVGAEGAALALAAADAHEAVGPHHVLANLRADPVHRVGDEPAIALGS
jgi:hypothetical protein